MNELRQFGEQLKTNAWRTQGARFNAARRLRLKGIISTYTIATLSIAALATALVEMIRGPTVMGLLDTQYSFTSIFLSLCILVLSLLEAGNDYSRRAERLHSNAMDLGKLVRRIGLELSFSPDAGVLKERLTVFQDAYNNLIESCSENHEPIDDQLFVARHRLSEEFGERRIGYIKEMWIALKWWTVVIWLHVLLLGATFLLIRVLFFPGSAN